MTTGYKWYYGRCSASLQITALSGWHSEHTAFSIWCMRGLANGYQANFYCSTIISLSLCHRSSCQTTLFLPEQCPRTITPDMHAAIASFPFSNSAFSPCGPSFRPWSRASPAIVTVEMLPSFLTSCSLISANLPPYLRHHGVFN
jgi:hypothetical protein